MVLPPALKAYEVETAGRLVVADDPGAEVKHLREYYGFTQEWLAGLLDMRRESLSRVESGRVNLSMTFLQNFTRIMTLARGVREHLASLEGRGGSVDDQYLEMISNGLRLDRRVAEEVVLASMMSYEKKRRAALKDIAGRPDPQWQEARPTRTNRDRDVRLPPTAKSVLAGLRERTDADA